MRPLLATAIGTLPCQAAIKQQSHGRSKSRSMQLDTDATSRGPTILDLWPAPGGWRVRLVERGWLSLKPTEPSWSPNLARVDCLLVEAVMRLLRAELLIEPRRRACTANHKVGRHRPAIAGPRLVEPDRADEHAAVDLVGNGYHTDRQHGRGSRWAGREHLPACARRRNMLRTAHE